MNDSDITLRVLTERDVPATADVLARAFADNPAYAWMHPRTATRPGDLRAFFERNLRWHLPLQLTWVAFEDRRVAGTSTLEPPGGVRSGALDAVAHWLIPTVRHQGLRTFLRTVAASSEFGDCYRALTQGQPYFHLHAVAVDPEFQGRGIGSRLVDAALREYELLSAREPAPIVVSTQLERNLPLYQRAGFTPKGDQQMGVRRGSRGYRTWFMLRAATR